MLRRICPGAIVLSALSLFVAGTVSAASTTTQQKTTTDGETLVVTTNHSESSLWNSPPTIQVIDIQTLQSSIRGEASSRVLVLIDGQDVTYQCAGDNCGPGLLINTSVLEQIEVVKGPWSVLYGSKAIGGGVHFITQKGGGYPRGYRGDNPDGAGRYQSPCGHRRNNPHATV